MPIGKTIYSSLRFFGVEADIWTYLKGSTNNEYNDNENKVDM